MHENFSNCTPLFSPRSSENSLNISDQLESIGKCRISANVMKDTEQNRALIQSSHPFFFGRFKPSTEVKVTFL